MLPFGRYECLTSPTYILNVCQIDPSPSDVRGFVHYSLLHELESFGSSGDNADDDHHVGEH